MHSQPVTFLDLSAKPERRRRRRAASGDKTHIKPLQALQQTPREWAAHPLNPVLCLAGLLCIGAAFWLAVFTLTGLL